MRPYGKSEQLFDPSLVVDYHLQDEFDEIPRKLLFDFIPRIYRFELPVLELWKAYFELISVPYAITSHTDTHNSNFNVLWKKRRI